MPRNLDASDIFYAAFGSFVACNQTFFLKAFDYYLITSVHTQEFVKVCCFYGILLLRMF